MDEADQADLEIEQTLDYWIERARRPIPDGEPGECNLCGDYFTRLLHGNCAKCRDEYRLP